jgi:hypothetical protein
MKSSLALLIEGRDFSPTLRKIAFTTGNSSCLSFSSPRQRTIMALDVFSEGMPNYQSMLPSENFAVFRKPVPRESLAYRSCVMK